MDLLETQNWFGEFGEVTIDSLYPATSQCARGAERKMWWLAEEELRESTERAFEAYDAPLENMTAFKYLGRVMTAGDDDWTAVLGNLWKARKSWGQLLRILIREGVDLKVLGHFSRR